MFTKLWGIGSNSFRETLREPVFGLIVGIAVFVLAFNPALAAYTLDDDNKFMQEVGLSTLLVAGLLLAVFGAARGLSAEVETRTSLTVLSKPVSRSIFLLGKFAGLAAAITAAMYLLTLAFLFTVRHKVLMAASNPYDMPVWIFGVGGAIAALLYAALANYWSRAHFPSTAMGAAIPVLTVGMLLTGIWNAKWQLNESYMAGIEASLVNSVILIWMAVMLLSAVSIAASTRLNQIGTTAVTVIVLLFGLSNDYLLGSAAAAATQPATQPADVVSAETQLKALAYAVLPNLNMFWTSDAIVQGIPVPFWYVLQTAAYALCYTAAVLCIGVALFQQREVA